MTPSPEAGPTQGGTQPLPLPLLRGVCGPPARLTTPSLPALTLGAGLSGDLVVPPPSCRLGIMSPHKSSHSSAVL